MRRLFPPLQPSKTPLEATTQNHVVVFEHIAAVNLAVEVVCTMVDDIATNLTKGRPTMVDLVLALNGLSVKQSASRDFVVAYPVAYGDARPRRVALTNLLAAMRVDRDCMTMRALHIRNQDLGLA